MNVTYYLKKKYDSTCSIQTNLMKKIYVYLLSSYYIYKKNSI